MVPQTEPIEPTPDSTDQHNQSKNECNNVEQTLQEQLKRFRNELGSVPPDQGAQISNSNEEGSGTPEKPTDKQTEKLASSQNPQCCWKLRYRTQRRVRAS